MYTATTGGRGFIQTTAPFSSKIACACVVPVKVVEIAHRAVSPNNARFIFQQLRCDKRKTNHISRPEISVASHRTASPAFLSLNLFIFQTCYGEGLRMLYTSTEGGEDAAWLKPSRTFTGRIDYSSHRYRETNQPPVSLSPRVDCLSSLSLSPRTADPLLPDDRGRRHLTMAASATEQFRPCRRVLTPGFSGANHPRAQGLSRIEPSPRVTPRPTGLRTNVKASRRSGYDVPDPGLVVRPIRYFVLQYSFSEH